MSEEKMKRCIAGLTACARAGMQTGPMLALNQHVLGTFTTSGVGYVSAATALLVAGFEPPEDPRWFSAALACNLLKLNTPALSAAGDILAPLFPDGDLSAWHGRTGAPLWRWAAPAPMHNVVVGAGPEKPEVT